MVVSYYSGRNCRIENANSMRVIHRGATLARRPRLLYYQITRAGRALATNSHRIFVFEPEIPTGAIFRVRCIRRGSWFATPLDHNPPPRNCRETLEKSRPTHHHSRWPSFWNLIAGGNSLSPETFHTRYQNAYK